MQKEQCNFKLTKSKPGKPPQWFADWYAVFSDKLFGKLDNIESRLDNVESRLDRLETRLDNLIIKNNLVE